MGCIPEKIIRGDSDFVEKFRDKGNPNLYAVRAVPRDLCFPGIGGVLET